MNAPDSRRPSRRCRQLLLTPGAGPPDPLAACRFPAGETQPASIRGEKTKKKKEPTHETLCCLVVELLFSYSFHRELLRNGNWPPLFIPRTGRTASLRLGTIREGRLFLPTTGFPIRAPRSQVPGTFQTFSRRHLQNWRPTKGRLFAPRCKSLLSSSTDAQPKS